MCAGLWHVIQQVKVNGLAQLSIWVSMQLSKFNYVYARIVFVGYMSVKQVLTHMVMCVLKFTHQFSWIREVMRLKF